MPWFSETKSWTVVVFVHGILSDNNAWVNKRAKTSWPKIVKGDSAFENSSIFLAGYESGINAGRFDVSDAADHVFNQLALPGGPLEKRRILFVCHSQGGIVVRQMLCAHSQSFAGKHVGLVLCGSPSWGSGYANMLAPITRAIGFRQAFQLRKDDPVLVNLDKTFQRLIDGKLIPNLRGVCLVETKGPVRFIPFQRVVWEDSASRYFPWQRIPKVSHSALVKPDSTSHPSHIALTTFAHQQRFLTKAPFRDVTSRLATAMARLERVYDSSNSDTLQQRADATIQVRQLARETSALEPERGLLPLNEVSRMLAAASDANGTWAFFDFDRREFSALAAAVRKIQAEASK